ncbi:MAG: hypothetical protein EOP50_12615 [Sphingobacteriales bacterium]|nr:MAG: hypothetical protein EOP50_12615 [Sphingobacteriales bacterium]
MGKFLAFAAIALLASCTSEPTADDHSAVVATTLGSLYRQIDRDVSAAGLCLSGHLDVPPGTIAKIKPRSIRVVHCSDLDLSKPGERVRVKDGKELAIQLSVDKVTFESSTTAIVIAHYSYGGLAAEGFAFTLGKTSGDWTVIKQRDLWIS